MLTSMTGFGRGEAEATFPDETKATASAEVRSINSRFVELSVRLPRNLNDRELEIRELTRKRLERGKISVLVTMNKNGPESASPLRVNEEAAKSYYALLNRLRSVTGLTAEVTLADVTHFGDVFESGDEVSDTIDAEWKLALAALDKAFTSLEAMRQQEGAELERDLRERIAIMSSTMDLIEAAQQNSSKEEFAKLKARVVELTQDVNVINHDRLEFEVAMLADRLDVTEEIVRYRSHLKFFLEEMSEPGSAGRKLNFILQEMNREINTIGSKTNQSNVAHHVVRIKQELERVREQVQNIE